MLDSIQVHHFKTDPFNWYVIEEAGRLTLVDAGFPGHYQVFRKGLKSIGREVSDVEAVLITHAHADHMGFADRVSRESSAPVWIHRADVAGAKRILQLPWKSLLTNAWRTFTRSMLIHATLNGVFQATRIPSPRILEDGDHLDVPGRPIVIHAPGHTPGEVAFYLPEAGILFSGDAIVTQDLYTGRQTGPQVLNAGLNDHDRQTRESLDRFMHLGRVTIYPGHGPSWHGEMGEALELAKAS